MNEEKKRSMDRRTFIKSAATGAGMIAATTGGLIGKERSEARTSGFAKSSFETPLPPVPAREIKEPISKKGGI